MVPISAREYIRRMPGGSQSHLLRASDNKLYVVKFVGNPQGTRILCNDLLASLLARDLGLSVPKPTVIRVADEFVRDHPQLTFQLPGATVPCPAGLQFGSTYICDSEYARIFDVFPASQLSRLQNKGEAWGAALFDTWVANADVRQAVYYRTGSQYRMAFIDQGGCFGGSRWTLPKSFISSGLKPATSATCSRSTLQWLSRIENLSPDVIWSRAALVPQEWYAGSERNFLMLVDELIQRRHWVRLALTRYLPLDQIGNRDLPRVAMNAH